MRFLMAVLSITRAARRAVKRRKCWVSAGGSHTRGKKSQRKSCANTAASTLSVLILASAIALVFSGLDTPTSATNGFRMATTSHVLVVASSATLSVGYKYLRPNSSHASRVHPQRLAVQHLPGLVDDTAHRHFLMDIQSYIPDLFTHCCSPGSSLRRCRGQRGHTVTSHLVLLGPFGTYLCELVAQPGQPQGGQI